MKYQNKIIAKKVVGWLAMIPLITIVLFISIKILMLQPDAVGGFYLIVASTLGFFWGLSQLGS